MEPTTITLHSDYNLGAVDPRVFSGFMEHLGRCIYEGLFDPGKEGTNEDGFCVKPMEALKRLKMTAMRYPGGNFVSGYHWMDGVGPRDKRPTRRDMAWQSIETNHFGTDEYIALCRKMDWTPMITVNLGTGTPEEARNWVEYCNCPTGTAYADMRKVNGSTDPYDVALWCLGNEMDGPWQIGHLPADQYAIRAQQAAKMMRDTDQKIELVVCGSSNISIPTYMDWDRKVLEYLGDLSDYISLHRYVGNRDEDTPDFLAITNSIDQQIEETAAVCRFVQAKRRSKKPVYLCFDEWNVWYREGGSGEGKFAPHLLEEVYNLEDALVVAGFLNSFIRHADVLKIANIAQIVNVIAPILTRGDDVLIQSIFYPLEMYASRREGISLQPVISGPSYEGKTNGEVTVIDSSAILNEDALNVFVTNRSVNEHSELTIILSDRPISKLVDGDLLTGSSPEAANRYEQPDMVKSVPMSGVTIEEGKALVTLPPLSFAAITFGL